LLEKMMLLMLLRLLLVQGLQVEPTVSSATVASQFSLTDYSGRLGTAHGRRRRSHAKDPVPEKKRALLIVAGLARHMEVTWPALEKAVVVPNEQAGYTFKTIFSTNTGLECNRESIKWSSRRCEEPSSDPKEHMDRIKKIMGARDVTVLHDDKGCNAPFHCAPWLERVHRVLATIVESGEKFDRVVALRPDIVLSPSRSCITGQSCGSDPFVEPPHLQLDRMCAEKPGFSFVGSAWRVRGRSYLHDRDLDFMHILCPGDELPAYQEATRVPLEPCSHPPYPPLPRGFHSTKGWDDRALFCRFVQVFTDRNVSISHWDDTYTATWPQPISFQLAKGDV
jgi:hypothetical protein